MEKDQITKILLDDLEKVEKISNTLEWCEKHNVAHNALVGVIKSLENIYVVKLTQKSVEGWNLTASGKEALEKGAAEVRILDVIPADGIALDELKKQPLYDSGFADALKRKWIMLDKSGAKPVVKKTDAQVEDCVKAQLAAVEKKESLEKQKLVVLQKRKLISKCQTVYYEIDKDSNFEKREKPETELTEEMLRSGAWETKFFKPLNPNALGAVPQSGYRHPLSKIRNEFRQIFLEMGFEEMPTDNYVESSFWNFDALFQPQQHPARDMHDTFFIDDPKYAKSSDTTDEYLKTVKAVHETGGFGSIGYRYDWKEEEARKNIFRTHTTAVSTRMLYKIAQQGFRPCKCFSIDRVFRNETIDLTHLAEFHQVEGFIADYNIGLPLLLATLKEFFNKLGMTNLRFKPAYNPYTEPSMELFCYHPLLKKEIEIGNSGVFRPEMLRPMGIPENVSVVAWGLSLERPVMIKYGIKTIRTLFGPNLSVDFVKQGPIFMIKPAEEEEKEKKEEKATAN